MGVELERLLEEAKETFVPVADSNYPLIREGILTDINYHAESAMSVKLSYLPAGSQIYLRASGLTYCMLMLRNGIKVWKQKDIAFMGPIQSVISEVTDIFTGEVLIKQGVVERYNVGRTVVGVYLPGIDPVTKGVVSRVRCVLERVENPHMLYVK